MAIKDWICMEKPLKSRVTATPAKISRPRLDGICPRPRLYKIMDGACQKPLIWVSGPAGSGKSTLVAGYLKERGLKHLWYQMDTRDADPAAFFFYLRAAAAKLAPRKHEPLPLLAPEYLLGMDVFSRNFFEKIYGRVKPPCVFVFDNFQELPEVAVLQNLFVEAFDLIPAGINVMVISRTAPPASLARIRSRQGMAHLDESSLLLTPEEIAAIAALYTKQGISERALAHLHQTTRGWAAGVTLMLEAAVPKIENFDFQTSENTVVFDYFATEIFKRTEPEIQTFMVTTALLPQFSATAARSLTGNTDADSILQELARRNYFTMALQGRQTAYQYHPLFRNYLSGQAHRHFSKPELLALQNMAAGVLVQEGDLESAVPLLLETKAWQELTDTIRQLGPVFMAQGRHLTLLDWLRAVPAALYEGHPWLLYWLATSRMPTDPDQSRGNYIEALELFDVQGIVEGIFLSWAGIVDTIVNQLADVKQFDEWIVKFSLLREQYAGQLPEQLMTLLAPRVFATLALRQPQHSDLPYWLDRVTILFESGGDPSLRILSGFYLLSYYLWVGDRARANRILEIQVAIGTAKNASPLTRITGRLGEAWYGWATGDHVASEQAVAEGVALADQSGVHVWTYILMIEACISALMTGNAQKAEVLLREFASVLDVVRPMDRLYYYHERAWQALLEGDEPKAHECQSRALDIAKELGAVYIEAEARYGMFHVCHAQGDLAAARTHINEARRLGEMFGSDTMAFQCDMADAQYFLGQGKLEEGLVALRSALTRVRKKGHIAFSWWRRDVMSRLCATALQCNIEPESACRIVRQHRLLPESAEDVHESWPWPVKVFTLGKFAVEVEGAPLAFSGKAQKKPLEMLQAIIALGGQNVPDEQIVDALWADTDGDLAMQSCRTTISRLRRLLRHEKAIITGVGKTGLAWRYVWTDVWAFEREMEQGAGAGNDDGKPPVENPVDRLFGGLARYKGEFLPGLNQPWVLPMRERLRGRYLEAIMDIGRHFENDGAPEQALSYYQKGLEADNLVEGLYQRLIDCYGKLGRGAEAVGIYNECTKNLDAELGIKPSEKTKDILKQYVNIPV
jgi:DNA-binding SARP family transcriptional activator